MARRAGCPKTGLSGSREAAVSKARNELIYSFYPIGMVHEYGRPRQTERVGSAVILEWVLSRCFGTNPSGGFGTDIDPARSTVAAVGSLHAVTYATGSMIRLGVRSKKPTAKSSTMKGA